MTSRFIYGTKVNVPEYMLKGGDTYRLITDQLGSVRLVVNASTGAVAQRIDYDEFGVATLVTGTWDFQPFGFAGGLYDNDTKLVRFGARDYDAETGRWVSKDPIGFSGGNTNLYGYVDCQPVDSFDPDGNVSKTWCEMARRKIDSLRRAIEKKTEEYIENKWDLPDVCDDSEPLYHSRPKHWQEILRLQGQLAYLEAAYMAFCSNMPPPVPPPLADDLFETRKLDLDLKPVIISPEAVTVGAVILAAGAIIVKYLPLLALL